PLRSGNGSACAAASARACRVGGWSPRPRPCRRPQRGRLPPRPQPLAPPAPLWALPRWAPRRPRVAPRLPTPPRPPTPPRAPPAPRSCPSLPRSRGLPPYLALDVDPALARDREPTGQVGLGLPQPRRVLELAGGVLETEVEELLPRAGDEVHELRIVEVVHFNRLHCWLAPS